MLMIQYYFVNYEVEDARNLKLILYYFELLSGLKINFQKSEVMLVLADEDKQKSYAEMFNYEILRHTC